MSTFALILVLAAAFLHATWNYLLKRSGGGVGFVWLFAAFSRLIYAPRARGHRHGHRRHRAGAGLMRVGFAFNLRFACAGLVTLHWLH